MMESGATKWSLFGRTELLLRIWGDEAVVFDAYSGNTYLVDQVAVSVLKYLENNAQAQDEIVGFCADNLGYELDSDFTSHVVSVLNHLVGLKLLCCEAQ